MADCDLIIIGGGAAAFAAATKAGDLGMSILDFDLSERISFAMGCYTLVAGDQVLSGYYTAVIQMQDQGPQFTALVFSGSGANEVSTGECGGA